MRLTKNFKEIEFLESVFFNDEQQVQVYESFNSDPELKVNLLELAENFQVLRDYLGKPISINISYRPKWYELLKGRSGKSQHIKMKAGDIKVKGMRTKEVHSAIEHLIKEGKMKQGGLGLYNTFVHYDIRGTKARW